ncbi:MAG: DUF2306 domain-containing protein [Vicinamibacterales bacterium]
MPIVARIHIGLAVAALVSGLLVTQGRKGTRCHRSVGWVYTGSMVGVNASALWIYRLTGEFSPFHVAALLSLATIVAGASFAWSRKPAGRWVGNHAY